MKRSVPEDFDPVYPYGKRPLNILPPFYSSNGFVEAPTETLSLKLANPVDFMQNGAIGLKLGGGLSINQDGELESQTITSTVNPPLYQQNGGLNLKYGEEFDIENEALKIKTIAPITKTENGLTLSIGDGLELNSNNTLQARLSSGLEIDNQAIRLRVHEPLNLNASTGALQCRIGNGLTVSDNSLVVYPHEPLNLDQTSGKLQLRVGNGINVQNSSLVARIGQGLAFNNSDIQINAAPPFTFSNNQLSIALGDGLVTNASQLKVKFGKGLFINSSDSSKLQVNIRPPLNYFGSSNSLTVVTGNGLGVSGTNLGSNLYVKTGNGLEADSSNVRVKIANGLQFTDGNIEANLGNGLTFSNGQITANIGAGLAFLNGQITLVNSTPSGYTDYTLWTTPDPSPNASIKTDLDAKLVLTLSKAGSTVIGTIGIFALKSPLTPISENSINVEIFFDANGEINLTTSSLKSYWGFREGDSYNPSSNLNPLYLMPNTYAYPQGRKTITQVFPLEVYLNGDTAKPVPLEVAFNTLSSTGFSLEFTWRNLNAYTGEAFAVSLGNFTYISQY
ncbi:fiber protein [Bovine adenovirus 2]|uniref:Fiber protein n=1 Tax=Bovine adenovirus 2 TaxID=114429 RepID=A0A9W4C845_ADEB2|nr:fiber protein [Bovine adenovirus 2]